MRSVRPLVLTLGLAMGLSTLSACDSEEEGLDWRGEELHFVAKGNIDGVDHNWSYTGADVAALELKCKREWVVPTDENGDPDYDNAQYVETKFNALLPVEGETLELEMEFKEFDMQGATPGDTYNAVPRVDGQEPGAGNFWLEWEWASLEGDDLYESAAQEGTFTLGVFSGTPDDTGVVIPEGDGLFGGLVNAKWSVTEEIEMSFTVPCTKNDVEIGE